MSFEKGTIIFEPSPTDKDVLYSFVVPDFVCWRTVDISDMPTGKLDREDSLCYQFRLLSLLVSLQVLGQ